MKLQKVSIDDIKLLWHNNYYDGMLSGYCILDGKFMYFDLMEQNESDDRGWYRRFYLIDVPEDEEIEVIRRHELFEKYVGTHCNYEENRRAKHNVKTQRNWNRYYDIAKNWPSLKHQTDGKKLAWFEW